VPGARCKVASRFVSTRIIARSSKLPIYRINTGQAYYHPTAEHRRGRIVDNVFTISRQLQRPNRWFWCEFTFHLD
jgi:hypothetical protein